MCQTARIQERDPHCLDDGDNREADNFAFAYIESVGMDPNALSTLLMRITAGDGEMVLIPEWFSTHPQSEDRVPEQPE
ncbi:MAG: M48 family metalloprotease [Pseudomonadota bacterium]